MKKDSFRLIISYTYTTAGFVNRSHRTQFKNRKRNSGINGFIKCRRDKGKQESQITSIKSYSEYTIRTGKPLIA